MKQGLRYFLMGIKYIYFLFCFGVFVGLILSFLSPLKTPVQKKGNAWCLQTKMDEICLVWKRI